MKGLDEDSLSRLEEDVKDLGTLLKIASPLVSVCERERGREGGRDRGRDREREKETKRERKAKIWREEKI